MGLAEPAPALEATSGVTISVAYSPRAGEVDEVTLDLPAGATVEDALARSGLLQRHPAIDLSAPRIGVWGKLRALDHVLRHLDRVEIYRPLLVDPKEARRLRYRKHRERTRA